MAEAKPNAVGTYIKKRRKELRLTQKEVAERLTTMGFERTDTTVANWEAGRQVVELKLIEPIADALEEPSPLRLYRLAGLFKKVSFVNLLLILETLPKQELDRIEERLVSMHREDRAKD